MSKTAIVWIVILIVVGLFFFFSSTASKSTAQITEGIESAATSSTISTTTTALAPTIITPPTTPIPTPKKSGSTMAEVAAHGDESDCWTTINGQVYNLTDWISQHPGGEKAIISICGKDGTSAFEGKHGGQGRPEATLQGFLIGPLVS